MGKYAKYFPEIYSSEVAQVPKDNEPVGGATEETGVIFMEQLEPAPSSVSTGMFLTGDLKKFREEATRRDKRLFSNPKLVQVLVSAAFTILQQTKRYRPDMLGNSPRCKNEWANTQLKAKWNKAISNFFKGTNKQAEQETKLSNFYKSDLKKYNTARWAAYFTPNGLALATVFVKNVYEGLLSSAGSRIEKDFYIQANAECFKEALLYIFLKAYSRPIVSGADRSIMKAGSSLRGIDQFFNSEAEVEETFPESIGVRQAIEFFSVVTGLRPFDVHGGNVMMRPGTNDIVIIDLGRFR